MPAVFDSPTAVEMALFEPLRIGPATGARIPRALQFAIMTLFWTGTAAAALALLALGYFAVMFVVTEVAPHPAILIGCLLAGEVLRWRAVRG